MLRSCVFLFPTLMALNLFIICLSWRGTGYLFHSSSLISKFSRWLPGRVSNALVGLLTLRLPSHGWVSILLFNFLPAILIVGLPPKGWQPVPQCVSASVVCRPGGPLELICRSNLNTNLRAESYNELNRLQQFAKH